MVLTVSNVKHKNVCMLFILSVVLIFRAIINSHWQRRCFIHRYNVKLNFHAVFHRYTLQVLFMCLVVIIAILLPK